MSTYRHRTKWPWNIAKNFNRLSKAHERYRQTTDGRTMTYTRTWTWVHIRYFITSPRQEKWCGGRKFFVRMIFQRCKKPLIGVGRSMIDQCWWTGELQCITAWRKAMAAAGTLWIASVWCPAWYRRTYAVQAARCFEASCVLHWQQFFIGFTRKNVPCSRSAPPHPY